jgi:hypothetical protein
MQDIIICMDYIIVCELKQNKKEKRLCNYVVKFQPYINSISRILSFQKMNLKKQYKRTGNYPWNKWKKYYLHRLSYYFVLE